VRNKTLNDSTGISDTKNRPRCDFAIDDPNEKNYTGHEMSSKNTTNLSEHIIFIASTHL
jgi:hypothetical protein